MGNPRPHRHRATFLTMVHLRHALDGYPLCWPMDKDGRFEGSFNETEVTCGGCLRHLNEEETG